MEYISVKLYVFNMECLQVENSESDMAMNYLFTALYCVNKHARIEKGGQGVRIQPPPLWKITPSAACPQNAISDGDPPRIFARTP